MAAPAVQRHHRSDAHLLHETHVLRFPCACRGALIRCFAHMRLSQKASAFGRAVGSRSAGFRGAKDRRSGAREKTGHLLRW